MRNKLTQVLWGGGNCPPCPYGWHGTVETVNQCTGGVDILKRSKPTLICPFIKYWNKHNIISSSHLIIGFRFPVFQISILRQLWWLQAQRRRQLPRSGGAHVLNVKLWGCGPRLRIIRPHESKLHSVSWGLGETTIRCRGRATDKLVAV